MRTNAIILASFAFALGPAVYAESEAIPEGLAGMPWYDAEADDYRRYSPDELNAPARRDRDLEQEEQPEQRPPEREPQTPNNGGERGQNKPRPPDANPDINPGVSMGFVGQALMFALVAVVASLLVYLVVMIIRERRRSSKLMDEAIENATISHSDLPESIAQVTRKDAPLNRKTLADHIQESLMAGDARLACIYMFLFMLLRLQTLGLIHLQKDRTAREYLRTLRVSAEDGQTDRKESIDAFARVVLQFELALYRESPPDIAAVRESWEQVQRVAGR